MTFQKQSLKRNIGELIKIKYLAGFDSIDDIFEQLKH